MKLVERSVATSGNLQDAKEEIKFIAEQLRKEGTLEATIDSAFCYYIAGYYIQAMKIARQIKSNKIDTLQKWMILFLKKDFKMLEISSQKIVSSQDFTDQSIREKINNDGLSDSEVVNLVINIKIAEVIGSLINYIETGDKNQLPLGLVILDKCQGLACKCGEWVIWWRLECLKTIFNEFVENSLWIQLKPFYADAKVPEVIEQYIVANYRAKGIVELWRTQSECLPKINDPTRCSFCISVPTSGGKTMVAELAVLRFLLDYTGQPDVKCVYIAPFRKLALEVEDSLSKSFGLIDDRLASAFYGGREVDVFDARDVEKCKILIVTPEKLDALLRQHPNLLSQIRLVIADEGHMVGENGNRSYVYRLLLERLIYKLNSQRFINQQKSRIILISGVLPNIEDFADLISGNRTNIVEINWRPLGEPRITTWHWTGRDLRLYDPKNNSIKPPTPFYSDCISQDKFEEITTKTAISYSLTRPTMVFSASAKAIYKSSLIDLLQCIVKNLPLNAQPLTRNIPSIKGYEKYYFLLEKGVAIHHGNLPRVLKKETEKRIANNQVQLLFTSPTLAQGVNIPFEVIIVYKLQHYQGDPITPSSFWNVVGRAGRPILQSKSSESPEILFFLNLSPGSNSYDQMDSKISKELLANRAKYQVVSPFLDFLLTVKNKWQELTAKPIAELITNLSEKKVLREIIGDINYSRVEKDNELLSVETLIRMFDEHINAIIRESDIDENLISEWLQQSSNDLVNLFVKATNINPSDLDYIKQAVLARIIFNSRFISSAERCRAYLLGLPVQDCELIKQNEEILLDWYKACEGIFSNKIDVGIDSFVNILNFVVSLSICKDWYPRKKSKKSNQLSLGLVVVDKNTIEQTKLFKKWLSGEELESLLPCFSERFPKKEFDEYREDMLESNIAWGVSAICRYLNALAEDRNASLTKDLDFLPSFIKYGVNTKIACQLVKLKISRVDATKISLAYKDKLQLAEVALEEIPELEENFEESINALHTFTKKELKFLALAKETVKQISIILKKYVPTTVDLELEPPELNFDLNEIA
jgi:hypothetical protein